MRAETLRGPRAEAEPALVARVLQIGASEANSRRAGMIVSVLTQMSRLKRLGWNHDLGNMAAFGSTLLGGTSESPKLPWGRRPDFWQKYFAKRLGL